MELSNLDSLWVLTCAALVFLMQAGFLCLETGLTRTKNAVNVALKNVADFGISILLFWAFGFALMFGVSRAGWIGGSDFMVPTDPQSSALTTTFLFQAMFCATAATIVSGAVSGRMRFGAYLVTTVIVSGLIYPVFGHWAWGGAVNSGPVGRTRLCGLCRVQCGAWRRRVGGACDDSRHRTAARPIQERPASERDSG